jgi:glycerophosphoryl diester phosphodiesterase
MKVRPLVIAHRGASAQAPENTLPAFQLGWKLGADAVECDVRLTADSQIVCLHDADTLRVSGTALSAVRHDFSELRKLDVGAWKGAAFCGTRIPLLSELLAQVPRNKQLVIEIKCGVEILRPLLVVIESAPVRLEQLTVISFEAAVIKRLKALRPRLRSYWLLDVGSHWLWRSKLKLDDVLAKVVRLRADGLGLRAHSGIHREMVEEILRAGLELNVWTVDDRAEARRLASFGVSSITSNRPDWVVAAIR